MFFVLLTIGIFVLAVTAVRRGPRAAAATAFALAVTLPCWIYLEVGAVRIDVRTALALAGIVCVGVHPCKALRPRLLLADALVVALVGTIIASEALSGIVTLTVVAEIVLQWLVPYALGRLVFSEPVDADHLIAVLVPVCLVLAGWAVVESVTRMNPVGVLLGHVGSLQSMNDLRWGLRRAEGPLTHPIFFGLHLVLLFPFALAAARQARDGGPAWHRKLPWIVAAGAFCTMSRGPQLGILITLAVATAVLVPRWRSLIMAPLVLAVVVGFTAGDLVLDLLHRWSGEKPMLIELDGETVAYTGTLHRLLQLRVYAEAVEHAGWLGYGSLPLRAAANTVPYVAEHLRQMFSSIDNHYLQFVLQCGYLGLGLFLLLCATTIGYAWQAAAQSEGATRVLAAGLGGALVALTLLMVSVWLASDYRFLLLAVMGSAGGLKLCVPRRAPTGRITPAPNTIELRLSPGYRTAVLA